MTNHFAHVYPQFVSARCIYFRALFGTLVYAGLSLPIVADLSTYYGIGATMIIETRCNAMLKQIGITFNTQLKIAVITVEPAVKYSFV